MDQNKTKAYTQLHIAVFLFGFTAILGRLISLKEAPLVWHRMWLTCLSLVFIPGVIKSVRTFPRKLILQFAGIGCIICLHWLTFYGSIKAGNVSVALSCLATASLFTSFLEPLIFKKRVNWMEVILGLLVILGIIVIFRVSADFHVGILLGVVSAFLAALFSTLNKKVIENNNSMGMTFVELSSGWLMLTLLLPFYSHLYPGMEMKPLFEDWIYLVILALLCTTLAFVLALNSLKVLSAFTSNLAINLEPVYGIILAAVIFGENKELHSDFYLGASLILVSVFLHPVIQFVSRRRLRRESLLKN